MKMLKQFQWIDLAVLANNPGINTDHVRHYAEAARQAINVFYDRHNPDRVLVSFLPDTVNVLALIARKCGYTGDIPKQPKSTPCPACATTSSGGDPVYVQVPAYVVLRELNLLEDFEEDGD